MNEIFSEICREQNEAFYEAERRRYVRSRRVKAAGEAIGCAVCVVSLYIFTVLMFCM